jgi:hypothetical protein
MLFGQNVIPINPCPEQSSTTINIQNENNLALFKLSEQSSTLNTRGAMLAVDGIISSLESKIARSNLEYQPWWEIDLGEAYFIDGIKIWYELNDYPEGLRNIYIFLSEIPFEPNSNLTDLIEAPHIRHVNIVEPLNSGQKITTEYTHARYVRIQMSLIGSTAFSEIQISGGTIIGTPQNEVCNNGLDDDFDCKIDCDDPDCNPILWSVRKKNPSCPICNDGKIEIKAYGNNLTYSIDNGQTFHPCNPSDEKPGWCIFDGLNDGNYDIKVSNNNCISTWRGVVA